MREITLSPKQSHAVATSTHGNTHLFPNHPAIGIVDVVHLVKDDPLDVPDHVGAAIEHGPEDFGRHNEAVGLRSQLDVPSQQPHIDTPLVKIAKLLVRERLDRRSVDAPGHVLRR